MLLALNGVTATLIVNNVRVFNHTFAPRIDADGFSYGLNSGVVRLGANNSISRIDNVKVQVVPPVTNAEAGEDFDDGVDDLFTAASGQWTVVGGRYFAEPAGGSDALAFTPFDVDPAAYVEVKATIGAQQFGGVIFDAYGPTDFKFAAFLPQTDQVVIGHRTSRGWFIDAAAGRALDEQASHNVQVVLKGVTATVFVNGQLAASHAFNALVTDSDLGLAARHGVALFDDFTVRSDDDQMQAGPSFSLAAEGEAASTLSATPMIEPGAKYWSNPLNRFDVDGSGQVGVKDLLHVVSFLRTAGTAPLRVAPPRIGPPNHVDVDRDGTANLADLLDLVQILRTRQAASQSAGNRDRALAEWAADDPAGEAQASTWLSFNPGEDDAWLDDFAAPNNESIDDQLKFVDAAISSWAELGRILTA